VLVATFGWLRAQPRSVFVALSSAFTLALALCAVPLLGIQGAESALVLGVVLPPMAAYVAAVQTQRLRAEAGAELSTLFGRVLGGAGLLWLVPVLVLGLDALRVRNCSPREGLLFMLLGPGFAIALAALSGSAIGLVGRRPRRALPLLAAGIPLASMLAAIVRFYTGPSIFAYGHFYGFFPGTLYDENIGLTLPFLWLRVATSIWILALCLTIVSCSDAHDLHLRARPRPGRALGAVAAALCIALGLLAQWHSDELGHTSSSASVRQALGGELLSRRCRLFFPREWARKDRARLADDCDFRVEQAEAWFATEQPVPVDVYLFRSPQEKYALMGAEGTNIAKPWRNEVYISDLGWPNPVLGHEVAHVVAGNVGRGPFRISGGFAGLWPNPALIEGVATAVAWQAQSGLTPHEWAHAMLELGMIPPLSELFGAGFLGQQKRLAYTLSGSLLRFVHERWGAAAIGRVYASGSLERGVGQPIAAIDAAWRAELSSQPLAASGLALARARFSGGSILSALCPHVLARLRDSLRADFGAGDDAGARSGCQQILTLDPGDAATRATLVGLLARAGDASGAAAELARMQREHAPAPYIAGAKQALADQALRGGKSEQALALYNQLLAEPLDDDQRRQLQVKTLAAQAAAADGGEAERVRNRRQAELLFELLIGEPGEHVDGAAAVYLMNELRAVRDDGLALYLEARQLFFQARFAYAAGLLHEARARGLPSPSLGAEALRVEAIARLGLGELDESEQLFGAFAAAGTAARASEAADYIERIAYLRRHTKSAALSGE
jgi:hypothetical protein